MATGFIGLAWMSVQVFGQGDALLVSDYTGDRVYLFRRERTTCLGAPLALIEDSDPQASGRFGDLVATHGNFVLTTDEADERLRLFELQSDGSYTLIFDHDAAGEITAIALGDQHIAMTMYDGVSAWYLVSDDNVSPPTEVVLISPDIPACLATCGNDVFFGFPSTLGGDGELYIGAFEPGTMTWTLPQTIALPPPPTQLAGIGPGFGFSVDCDGDTLIVGAPGVDNEAFLVDAGRAYVYKRDAVSGDWTFSSELTSLIPQDGEQFGYDVAVCGSVASPKRL